MKLKPGNLLTLALVILPFLLVACQADLKQSTWGTAGPVAEKQLLLFNVLLWVMVVVFIAVEGVLLYAVIKFRRRPGQGLPHQTHGNTVLEVTWTVIPTILILGLGAWSVTTLFDLDEPPRGSNPLDVVVTGHQWWFEFEYEDADGAGKRIVTANQLNIPVGRPVRLDLKSDDVIHSFWIPKLAGKVDLVPTRTNKLWIQADEAGEYYGQCAEFCGIAHALMKFRVVAVPPAEFQTWAQNFGQPPQNLSPMAQRGQETFLGPGQCWICHTIDGVPRAVGAVGPSLTGVGNRTSIGAGLLDTNRENLRRWIRNPDKIKPGNIMARDGAVYQTADGNNSLSEAQLTELVEYLISLK